MTEEHKEHHGEHHHTEHKNKKVSKLAVWKSITVIIGILLLISLISNFSGKPRTSSEKVIGIDKASEKAISYINNYLLQPGTTATLQSKSDIGTLYNLKMNIGGREFDSYVTKDGKLLFPNAVDLTIKPETQPTTPSQQVQTEVNVDGLPFKGTEDAKVTIVEYSSFSCGYCNRARGTIDQILETYPDDVKFVYKHFNRGGTDSQTAQATECAGEQDKFWEMHDIIFDKGSSGDLKQYAKDIGLDTDSFNQCLDSGKYSSKVAEDTSEARSLGIGGTPGFIINGQLVSGAQPFENFKAVIDAELAK